MKLLLVLGAAAAMLAGPGCVNGLETASGGGNQGSRGPFAQPCDDELDDVYTAPSTSDATPPGELVPGTNCDGSGVCFKCASDTIYQVKDIKDALEGDGYSGPATDNLEAYRFVYGTERLQGGVVKSGVSSALLLVPTASTAADTLVVVAYDTVGFGPQCAPSLEDPLAASDGDDHAMALAVASHGYLTLVIDFAGMGLGTVPPGWNLAEDEAHSLLDATRAIHTLLPEKQRPSHVVLMGLGEGGHAVLSAQAIATKYGLEGKLDGVVAFAPIWVAPRTWGAALSGGPGLNDESTTSEIAYDLLYFYGHGEVYDGPGGGVTMLRDDQRTAARDLVQRRCFSDLVDSIPTLGKYASDIFDPTFVHQVSSCAIAGSGASCHEGAAVTWNPRFSADRPASDPEGAPILVWQGGADTVVPPDRAICGKDKLDRDLTSKPSTLTYCGDDKASHGEVVERDIGWALSWIDGATGHGAAPKPCAAFAPKNPDGTPVTCIAPPPNSN